MEFPIDDTDDIFFEPSEVEVTNSEPDPTRTKGSVHHGAGYLSSGKHPHTTMVGGEDIEIFGDLYSLGCDVLGASATLNRKAVAAKSIAATTAAPHLAAARSAGSPSAVRQQITSAAKKMADAKVNMKQRAGIVKSKTPGGRTITSLRVNQSRRWNPQAAIKNAQDAAKRAINVGTKLKAAANKLARKGTTTVVRGLGPVRGPVKVKPGAKPRPKLSIAQMKRFADRAVQAGKVLQKQVAQFKKVVQGNDARVRAGISKVRSMVKLRGLDDDEFLEQIFGEHMALLTGELEAGAADLIAAESALDQAMVDDAVLEILGASTTLPGAVLPPDPTGAPVDPYATSPYGTSPYGTDPYAVDPYAADPYGSDPYAFDPADPTYGLGPAPTEAPPMEEGVDFIRDPNPTTDKLVYSSDPSTPGAPLPLGAVIYDGSEPFPWMGVGSYTRFHGGAPEDRGGGFSGYQWGGGNAKIMDGWYLFWAKAYNVGIGDLRYKKEGEGEHHVQGTGRERSDSSTKGGWGPLVGNPDGWTKGLRYDVGGNQWFWFYDQAPKWAKAPGEMQRLNQAILEYKAALTAAQAEAAAQALADQAEQKEYEQQMKQQAKEDAEYQRQMDREAAAAEQQAALQALEDERWQQRFQAQHEAQMAADEQRARIEEEREMRQMQAEEERELRRLEKEAEQGGGAEAAADETAEVAEASEEGVDLDEENMIPESAEDLMESVEMEEEQFLGDFESSFLESEGFFGSGVPRASDRLRYRRDVRRGEAD